MDPLEVELVSPERVAYSGTAQMVICRTASGDIAFQAGHVPFLGTLQTYLVRIIGADGSDTAIAVHQGFVSVSDNKVTILSDVCEIAGDIDVARAERAKSVAEAELVADPDDLEAAAALRRADVRLDAATRA